MFSATLLDLIVDALAVHRATRIVTADVISRPMRARVIRFSYDPFNYREPLTDLQWEAEVVLDDDPPFLATLVTCRWCTSTWLALLAVAGRRYCPQLWAPVATALALSSAGSLLAAAEAGYAPEG